MNQTRNVPLLLGAMVGLGIVMLIDPHHGEARRARLKRGCATLGENCTPNWLTTLLSWSRMVTHAATDFEAEVRAHAPSYLQ